MLLGLAGCVRKELDLLYYHILAGKTVFWCVWYEMGQQQLPQQPVLPLLCPAVGHLMVALQIRLELGLGAMRAAHAVWDIGKCLAEMRVRRLLSFCGVVFPPVLTVPVQWGCRAVPLPVLWVTPLSRGARWVEPSSFLATSMCHCRLYLKAHVRTQKNPAYRTNLQHVAWHGWAETSSEKCCFPCARLIWAAPWPWSPLHFNELSVF